VAALAVLFAGVAAQPSNALPGLATSSVAKAGKVQCKHVSASELQAYAETIWPLIRWERGRPRPIVIRAWRGKLRCAAGPGHRKAGKARWAKAKRAFYEHRQRKLAQLERLRYLPFVCGGGTRSAIPCSIMWCESKGSYAARNGISTAGGKYQILDSTWYAYGGAHYPTSHPAAVAPRAEQDRVAAAIYADVGSSAWACA